MMGDNGSGKKHIFMLLKLSLSKVVDKAVMSLRVLPFYGFPDNMTTMDRQLFSHSSM